MAIGKFYDNIDIILQSMMEYHGIDDEDEEDYFDDYSDEDDENEYFEQTNCKKSDIDACGHILENYIDELSALVIENADDNSILKIVSKTVKKLNKLNEKCDYELIESTQSDDICEFIHNAAVEAGLDDIPDNVTDEWREF